MKQSELYISLCDEAYPAEKRRSKRKESYVNPLACVECESICMYGTELLKTIEEKQFRSLLCGSDCYNCRQPCNLRRIALMRNITSANSQKEKMRQSWLRAAMRPYYERRKEAGNHEASLL